VTFRRKSRRPSAKKGGRCSCEPYTRILGRRLSIGRRTPTYCSVTGLARRTTRSCVLGPWPDPLDHRRRPNCGSVEAKYLQCAEGWGAQGLAFVPRRPTPRPRSRPHRLACVEGGEVKPPTPLQLAKMLCANHQNNGTCLGCPIEADLSTPCCSPRPTCRMADDTPTECRYFELHLIPAHPEVEECYRRAVGLPSLAVKKCAQCGQPRLHGKRYCTSCAAKRRTETYRTSKRRARQKPAGMSTFHEDNHVVSLGNTTTFSSHAINPRADSHAHQSAVPTVDRKRGAA
jgi:hypothetical protein